MRYIIDQRKKKKNSRVNNLKLYCINEKLFIKF